MSAEGGIDGNVTGSVRRLYTGRVVPDGSVSALIRRGASSINLSAGFGNVLNHEEGTDTADRPGHRRAPRVPPQVQQLPRLQPLSVGQLGARAGAPTRRSGVNARWSPGQFDLDAEQPRDRDRAERRATIRWSRTMTIRCSSSAATSPGRWPAERSSWSASRPAASATISTPTSGRNGLLEDGAVQVGGFEQTQKAKRNETIGRLNWTRQNLAGFSFEAGGEARAQHARQQDRAVRDRARTASRTRSTFRSTAPRSRRSAARRSSTSAASSARRCALDAGHALTNIRTYGHAATPTADRKLKFWKPSADHRLEAGRRLAHANFRSSAPSRSSTSSISSASPSCRPTGSTPATQNLQPQRAWEFRGTVDRPILGDGLIKLDLGYDHISMLQDRVLICDDGEPDRCFDAPGNIGTGKRSFRAAGPSTRRWRACGRASGSSSTARCSAPGSRTRSAARCATSATSFPTGNGMSTSAATSGAFSYGFVVATATASPSSAPTNSTPIATAGRLATAFVEYRPGPRTLDHARSRQCAQHPGQRNRLLFLPNRAEPDTIINEFRERNRHLNFGLTIKQTFGGGGVAKSD